MDAAKESASLAFALLRQNDIEAPFFSLSGLIATGCRNVSPASAKLAGSRLIFD
jgi:hypothetical protein